jgi:acetoacetyl-CoA synthetase
MSQTLWQPDLGKIKHSELFAFINYINHHHQHHFSNYQSLHHWSIHHKADFWQAISHFFKLHFHHPYKEILKNENKMPGATWFEGATLNYAEHCLDHPSNKLALVSINEDGQKTVLSFGDLKKQVAKLANSFCQIGVKPGDKIAAILPNRLETVIAFLASASIGAIFSSCSPDFGSESLIDRLGQIEPKVIIGINGYYYNGQFKDCINQLEALACQCQNLEKIILVPYQSAQISIEPSFDYDLWEDFLSDDINFKARALPFDHPLYILFSSGTTGQPKCIIHGAGNSLIQHLKELGLHTNITEKDKLFYYTTCGWMMWNWSVSALALGATLILYDASPLYPNETRLLDIVEKEKITVFGTSAKYLDSLEKKNIYPCKSHDLSALKTILSTGSPLNPHSFDYVYQYIKKDLLLASISGGTDIVSCFVLGCPIKPVKRGEIQCIGLGMDVAVFNEKSKAIYGQKGELVCLSPFPSMPLGLLNDPDGKKYHQSYFSRYNNVWAHGDFACLTKEGGIVIYGRSDTVLNPGGVRIGSAEIYRQVEKVKEVIDCVAVGQLYRGDERIILFVQLKEKHSLNESLIQKIKQTIRRNATPRHVPAMVIQVPDIPKTRSGKTVELVIKKIINHEKIDNISQIANPQSLNHFKNLMILNQ